MRQFQVTIFILGVLSFIIAAFFIGKMMGDTLWRIGVAAMVFDIVCIKLWPTMKSIE